jgi:formylglycine-generating enzyme required for sulfatase activity
MITPLETSANGHTFRMIPVLGGSFLMGSKEGEEGALNEEKPQHSVTVSDFYIGQYPVTQALWKVVMDGKNPSYFQGDDRPVENVSWYEAQQFLKALNPLIKNTRLEGNHYRLPTEAEWEYAARGGPYQAEGYKYSGSDRLKDVGWFRENSSNETNPVGLKYPNQLGIYDMSGNVWEWCADDWHGSYKGAPDDGRAWVDGRNIGVRRVGRGGSWGGIARYCRANCRFNRAPSYRFNHLGFRLVLSLQSAG